MPNEHRNSAKLISWALVVALGMACAPEGVKLTDASLRFASQGASDSVRFLVVGDTGKGSDTQQRVAQAMASVCRTQDCEFVLLLGDNFYESGVTSVDDPLWESHFVRPYQELDVPFFAILGNHDYGLSSLEASRAHVQLAYGKKNSKWRMPSTHYTFGHRNVDFFAIDSNLAMQNSSMAMAKDVREWLAASTAKWKLVFGHHPYRSNGTHGNAGAYDGLNASFPVFSGAGVKSFLESVVCGHADFYFSGHDHSLQWLTETCEGTELVVSGGGGSKTAVTPRNTSYFSEGSAGFFSVEIQGSQFTGTFFNDNGDALFRRTLEKP